MLLKEATIAAATLMALASMQAAAETRRGGGMAAGDGGMAAGNKAGRPGVQPWGARTKAKSKKAYKGQTPPTRSQPYCPYGKKADGTCWVRCRYTICL